MLRWTSRDLPYTSERHMLLHAICFFDLVIFIFGYCLCFTLNSKRSPKMDISIYNHLLLYLSHLRALNGSKLAVYILETYLSFCMVGFFSPVIFIFGYCLCFTLNNKRSPKMDISIYRHLLI